MNFSANEYTHNTGSSSKILAPGEHYCRILEVGLSTPPWKAEAYFITLKLEGPDMGADFEGIALDKNNPAMGTHKGQIATVNSFKFPFSDYNYNGKDIMRDNQIFNWINALATQLGVFEDIQRAKINAATIEDYVAKVSPFLTNPELWATFTVAGREYYKDGYDRPNYNLYFPKKEGKNFPYTVKNDEAGNPVAGLIRYDETKHIDKAEKPATSTEVDSFGTQPSDDTPSLDF